MQRSPLLIPASSRQAVGALSRNLLSVLLAGSLIGMMFPALSPAWGEEPAKPAASAPGQTDDEGAAQDQQVAQADDDAAMEEESDDEASAPEPVADPMKDRAEIDQLLKNLQIASNKHNLEGVLKNYSSRFISGDNLSLNDISRLIEETWKTFPDIQYQSETIEIRIDGNWATVESIDTATATTRGDSVISDLPGRLQSRSRGLLYLHKVGGEWEIQSDYTLHETAEITQGNISDVNVSLSTPEQVFAGESYTAQVSVDTQKNLLTIATISKEPLVYPQQQSQDKFRSLSSERGALARIFAANRSNNNEIVTATVGLTEIGHDDDRPSIKLSGLKTIVKRVNIIPKSQFTATQGEASIVRHAANGAVDLDKKALSAEDEEKLDSNPLSQKKQ
ncbi:MAG: nuclear transport factor 2 family protein [Candidatus Melainabacteria bacterium]